MPIKSRTNIGRRTRTSRHQNLRRRDRTEEERLQENELNRVRMAQRRAKQSEQERSRRLDFMIDYRKKSRVRIEASKRHQNGFTNGQEAPQICHALSVLPCHCNPEIDYYKQMFGEMHQEQTRNDVFPPPDADFNESQVGLGITVKDEPIETFEFNLDPEFEGTNVPVVPKVESDESINDDDLTRIEEGQSLTVSEINHPVNDIIVKEEVDI